jgi:hypothetical protein
LQECATRGLSVYLPSAAVRSQLVKLLYDLNSLWPPRRGISYYTQHLIEGLLRQPDVEDIARWVGSTLFQGASLDALMRTDVALGKAAQFSGALTAP